MTPQIEPGLIVLHGNRLELLRDAVFDWLGKQPLDPLEEEIFLVQSNGAAEWLKMSLAQANGICAATRVELPGRFLWRAYRQVLGREHVRSQSALERSALTWRVMRLLPELLDRPSLQPVAAFLVGGDLDRRLQLARRLADLYDQYQVYRADWLAAWERGRPVLPGLLGPEVPLADDQRWQMELWRAILGELSRQDRASTRLHVHRAFIEALTAGMPAKERLPRRVVLFGAAHIPVQTLEVLAALATRLQVLIAVPNPCRFHWADIIDGREALQILRRRHPASDTVDLSTMPLEAMHLHAHPLLAAWGRQGRDFMRQLDAFDDAAEAQRRFELPRIDFFDEGPGKTLLQQVQADIRDLVPLAEHPHDGLDRRDRSIVFHVAHGAQREVEILHDQLLALFAEPHPPSPRQVVVMVPDIETFAPAIRAVFGQHRRDDARRIPFDIADLRSRGSNPLVVAIEWLLRIPDQRIRVQEVRDLLDVPAIAARVGVEAEAIPALFAWLAGSGVRWGLHEAQRAQLGLGAAGEQNSWLFGLRRMLLGYATGAAASFADIEPYDEIGGLDASVVGSLAELFERLDRWWSLASRPATPVEWAARGRTLIADFLAPSDERERLTIAALQAALSTWLESCEMAQFVEPVPLSVLREAWLSGVDGLDANRRFLAGGVTFCTLMPLRAVPFEVVCLLGMNDGDFPRRSRRDDFDLMALPGQQRPGDRSRRDDDRYLMLEALLSARRTLYVSWCGHSARDNSEQPPSVLVSQLRDYLRAGWNGPDGRDVVAQRTTEHPLQPFSRRYFEGGGLTTFAREWRVAHVPHDAVESAIALPLLETSDVPLTVADLVRFLKNPVREFFRARLDVRVSDDAEAVDEDEPFGTDGLELFQLRQALLDDPAAIPRDGVTSTIARRLERLAGAGRLPLFALGARLVHELAATVEPMIERWIAMHDAFPEPMPKLPLRADFGAKRLDDWLDGLRSDGARTRWIEMSPSRLMNGKKVRSSKLLAAWTRMLVASACGHAADGVLIGPDATLEMTALDPEVAGPLLADLVAAWNEGMSAPLPFAMRTALALVEGGNPTVTYDGGHAVDFAEGGEFSLRRTFADHEALVHDGRFETYATRLFKPMSDWIGSSVVEVVE